MRSHLLDLALRWAPVAAWMSVLFLLSAQPGLAISEDADLDWVLRKGAHVGAYSLLALLVARAVPGRDVRRALVAFVIASLYGVTDEYHQTLVPTRAGELRDVGFDALGAALGAIAWLRWRRWVPRDVELLRGEARIEAAVEVAAPPSIVWSLLRDPRAWERWNPHQRVAGQFLPGDRVRVTSTPPGGARVVIRPRIERVDEGRELTWLGWWLHPRLFAGEHRFLVEPLPDGATRFVQSERFSGLLLPLYLRSRLTATRRGFVAANEALRRAAEGTRHEAPSAPAAVTVSRG